MKGEEGKKTSTSITCVPFLGRPILEKTMEFQDLDINTFIQSMLSIAGKSLPEPEVHIL